MNNNLTYVFPVNSYTDLTIYQYGMEKCDPMLACGPAINQHYLLHYILSGKGLFRSENGSEYKMAARQAFLIHPNTISFYCADSHDPWQYIWVEFGGLKAPAFIAQAGLTVKNPIYIPEPGVTDKLQQNFTSLVENHSASPLRLIGTMYFIIDELIKTSRTKEPGHEDILQEFYVHEALNYIERNYDKNINVNDIAAWCNLNRSYFGKIFKDTMLVTPREFLMKYRMNRACDLLREDLPIMDIALQVGYENPLHFTRAFHNVVGISPREWRKQNSG